MGKLLDILKGKKTYLVVAVAFILAGCNAVGWIDQPTTEKIYGILGFLGLGFLRAGVSNASK